MYRAATPVPNLAEYTPTASNVRPAAYTTYKMHFQQVLCPLAGAIQLNSKTFTEVKLI